MPELHLGWRSPIPCTLALIEPSSASCVGPQTTEPQQVIGGSDYVTDMLRARPPRNRLLRKPPIVLTQLKISSIFFRQRWLRR